MRRWQGGGFAIVALVMCLALGGCGNSAFGSGMSCSSATQCTVTLQEPASNSDPFTWTVSASDPRVRIVPSHGVIAPGQTVNVTVTLPAGACGIQLTGTLKDAVWPLGLGGGGGFGTTVPSTCSSAQAAP